MKEKWGHWSCKAKGSQPTQNVSFIEFLADPALSQPFCCSYWPLPSPLPQHLPSCAALKFANSEYVIVSGKATSLFSYSWHLDWHWFSFGLHLFSHLEFYFLGKVQRKTKKSSLENDRVQPLWLSLVPFIVLTSSWIRTRAGAVRLILSSMST